MATLKELPSATIDFCMTSPPYWNQREYESGGNGLEQTPDQYVANLLAVFAEVRRILKPSGSFWLNVGDTYRNKSLLGIPWRLAIALMDEQRWLLRNEVIWNKIKGPDNARDKLRNIHEQIFHFVKDKEFYYDVDAVRSKPREARVVNGAVISATGVSGVRYRRQIELSTSLTEAEKRAAFQALEETLRAVAQGKLSDFRMVIRNQQRATHSDSERLSGRAKELQQKGFYFLKYHPDGSKPSDVWDILPEDTQNRIGHYAAYPEDLCKIPLLATCPPDGIALDPFCGTGTTNLVAQMLQRKSVGIDLSPEYIEIARRRCQRLI
jgi:DNA modification methylase